MDPIVSAGLSIIPKFKEEIKGVAKLLQEEADDFFNLGLTNYLNKEFERFNYTKTFLFRDETVQFYDVFFPVKIVDNKKQLDSTKILKSLFRKTKFVTLIGNAGSGKTMLTKHIFLSCYNESFKIPIVIELRHLNDYASSIENYIYNIILANKVSPSKRILERSLETGNFLFLFDGYDEIFTDKKQIRTKELEEFIDKYSQNHFVITSRPGANAEELARFKNLFVSSLNDKDIYDFIKKQLSYIDEAELMKRIISVIKKTENSDYIAYLRSPLLLSMFILTFNQFPDLPRSKNRFYYNVFETLITKHDSLSKRGGFQHERKTRLLNEDIELILKWFSYISYFKGEYSFDKIFFSETLKEIRKKLNLSFNIDYLIDDLTVSVSVIILDGNEYKFPHKSFQEYFCASLIKDLDIKSKLKVYTEVFANNLDRHREINNFFSLCIELDKQGISEYFFLPILKRVLKDIKANAQSSFDLIENFSKITGCSVGFRCSKDSLIERVYFGERSSIENRVLQFFKLSDFVQTIYNNIESCGISFNEVERLHADNLIHIEHEMSEEEHAIYDISFRSLRDDRLKEIAQKLRLPYLIDENILKIEEQIQNIERELALEQNQTVSLLDL